MIKDMIFKKAQAINKELISIRRDIHAYPEFALQEYRTSAYIASKLRELGLDVQTNIGITGVIGTLKGYTPGKTIMIRADMDCLKIEEQTDLEFKSKNPGFMHACGHDAHIAWVIGAAMILKDFKEGIQGNIKFLFQPAEEIVGGAERMIRDGALENPKVDAAIGAHVWPSLPSGSFGLRYGEMMAAPDTFIIKIKGKGGHGATPHNCIDPIAIGCQVYTALQNIVSRRNDPVDPLVITVGKFVAGSAPNIIPEEVLMEGTTRTFSEDLRNKLPQLIETTIKGITEAYGATYEFLYDFRYPAVINHSSMVDLAKDAVETLFGSEKVQVMKKPEMIGEDFSYFQKEVPSVFLAIGNSNKEKGTHIDLHNPTFKVDEDIIHSTSALLSLCALNFLNYKD